MATPRKTAASVAPTLPASIFEVEVKNHELLKLAYDAYLANGRVATATTKTRGEVSGGGKKPWKQKGTGRARFGSSRNPIWRTGGIVFGPSGNENYSRKISTNTKRVALRQALSLAHQAGKVSVIDIPTLSGKTKELVTFLDDKGAKGRVLLVVDEKTPEILRASKNIANVEVIRPLYLSVYHILNADTILLSGATVAAIENWLGGDK